MRQTIGVLLCLLAGVVQATPREAARCSEPLAQRYVEHLGAYHDAVAALAVGHRADLASAAEARTRMERLGLQRQAARLAWAARHDPDRISLTQGLGGLMSLAWSEADEKRLAGGDPDYADLSRSWTQAEAAERRHPKRDALQAVLKSRVLDSPGYREAGLRLAEQVSGLTERLAACAALTDKPVQSLTE